MKDAYYFSHDANARHDPKILAMRSVYKAEGYGWYWMIVETLREQSDFRIKIDKYTWNALAMQMQCECNAVQKFVSDCINEFGLLQSDGEFFWSDSLIRRMEFVSEKSEKARKAAETRWNKTKKNKGSMQSDSTRNADAMQTQCGSNAIKEKESKEKKSKEKESSIYADADFEFNPDDPFTFYQNNFGVINPFLADNITNWCKDLSDALVTEAMKRAISQNKRTWSYVTGILKGWHSKGIKTIEQADAEQAAFERQKQSQSTGRQLKEDKLPAGVQWQMQQTIEPQTAESKTIDDLPELKARLEALRKNKKEEGA